MVAISENTKTIEPSIKQDTLEPPPENNETIEVIGSQELINWLFEQNVSLTFTSYQLGKFFFIGRHPPAGLSVFQRNFVRCMGLAVDEAAEVIYLSTLYQIWRFKNSLLPGDDYQGYDRIYTPQSSYYTGDIDTHDMDIMGDGRLIFVNTLFSCLSTLSDNYSFEVFWKPRFISKLAAEDRCHLNGVALENGQPKYVTAFAQTNSPNSWRDYKQNGGVIIDIASNEILCGSLSMPHSPRIYKDKLWVLNSGTGYLGYVELTTGKFHEVTFCPGYLRGLKFVGDYAIVGLSRLRPNHIVASTKLEENLQKHNEIPHCGICFIDLRTGVITYSLELSGALAEIYDIGVLPNIVKPMAIGIENDGIRRLITIPATKNILEKDAFMILENLRQN